MSAVTPKSLSSSSAAAMTSRRMVPEPISWTWGFLDFFLEAAPSPSAALPPFPLPPAGEGLSPVLENRYMPFIMPSSLTSGLAGGVGRKGDDMGKGGAVRVTSSDDRHDTK